MKIVVVVVVYVFDIFLMLFGNGGGVCGVVVGERS